MTSRRTLMLVAVPLALLATAGNAQQERPQQAGAGLGVVAGVVIDSIRGGVVSGALVGIESARRSAISSETGRFVLDSVPAGEHRLVLQDDLLDTLGLSVVTPPLQVRPGDTLHVVMSIPSPETVVRAKCGPGPFPGGGGALLGLVIDADTESRVAGAEVVLAWMEVQASREAGVRQIPRQRSARSAEDGSYRICGLPTDVAAELQASRGRDTTAVIPFRFGVSPLAVYTLALPGASAEDIVVEVPTQPAAGAQRPAERVVERLRRGRATIRGVVTNTSGMPISAARVSVIGAEGATLTDEKGAFVLQGQPGGSQTVIVRRLGYEPAQFAVNLSPVRATDVNVEMATFVPVLSEVIVRATAEAALERIGFTQRQRRGMGNYMTIEEIDRRNALRLVDLLAMFPVLRSAPSEDGRTRVLVGRGRGTGYGCINFIVDGMPWLGDEQPIEFIHPQEVGAIEVYSAGITPGEFIRPNTSCETVVLWSRHRLGIR